MLLSIFSLKKLTFIKLKVYISSWFDWIGLGLTETSVVTADANESETRLAGAPKCLCQTECPAIQLCIDCLLYVCLKCQQVHHSLHKTVSHNSLGEQSSGKMQVTWEIQINYESHSRISYIALSYIIFCVLLLSNVILLYIILHNLKLHFKL